LLGREVRRLRRLGPQLREPRRHRRRRSAVAGDVAPGRRGGGGARGSVEETREGSVRGVGLPRIRADLEKLSDQILVSRGPKSKACGANTNFTTQILLMTF
jgi:hypothetical protein